jgi:hypothetical protein
MSQSPAAFQANTMQATLIAQEYFSKLLKSHQHHGSHPDPSPSQGALKVIMTRLGRQD